MTIVVSPFLTGSLDSPKTIGMPVVRLAAIVAGVPADPAHPADVRRRRQDGRQTMSSASARLKIEAF
jgi:hypothetical protein